MPCRLGQGTGSPTRSELHCWLVKLFSQQTFSWLWVTNELSPPHLSVAALFCAFIASLVSAMVLTLKKMLEKRDLTCRHCWCRDVIQIDKKKKKKKKSSRAKHRSTGCGWPLKSAQMHMHVGIGECVETTQKCFAWCLPHLEVVGQCTSSQYMLCIQSHALGLQVVLYCSVCQRPDLYSCYWVH